MPDKYWQAYYTDIILDESGKCEYFVENDNERA